MTDRYGESGNGVNLISINPETQEHDNPETLNQTENGGLEAGQAEMEAGRLSARDTAGETPKGRGQIKLPSNIRNLLNALERHTGKRPQYVGQDRGYGGHPRHNWIGHCPLHRDRRPSLSVSFDLVTGWAIPKCPVCPGTGDRQGRNKWVACFCEKLGLGHKALCPVPEWKPIIPTEEEPEPGIPPEELEARLNLLNQVYGHISQNSGLLPEHKQNLLNRGLTEDQINKNGYFSVELVPHGSYGPCPQDSGLFGAYDYEKFAGVPGVPHEILEKIPGFRMKSARRTWTKKKGGPALPKHLIFRPNNGEGLFIPARDSKGRIIGGQIRSFVEKPKQEPEIETEGSKKKKKKAPKYRWLPKNKEGVWAQLPGSWAHVPLGFKPSERIVVTEGVLKADIATVLGYPCLGVPGIGQWRKALPLLEEWKPREVVIAYDAVEEERYEASPEKLNADNFARELRQRGFKVMIAQWAFADAKGIDELLFKGGTPEEVEYIDPDSQLRKMMPHSPQKLWEAGRGFVKIMAGTVWERLFLSDPKARIIRALFEETEGPVTRTMAELVKRTGMPRSTVRRALEDLITHGDILADGDTYTLPLLREPQPVFT